jgi:hypothetical protein
MLILYCVLGVNVRLEPAAFAIASDVHFCGTVHVPKFVVRASLAPAMSGSPRGRGFYFDKFFSANMPVGFWVYDHTLGSHAKSTRPQKLLNAPV